MRRRLYLSALLVVQLALVVQFATPLAHALRVDTAPGLAPAGWPALLQLVATAAAVAGTSLALVFPGLALARHQRVGAQRFMGMPRWAVTLALSGALVLAVGVIALVAAPMAPGDARLTLALVARPVIAGGLALATAGVLCAELLRRNRAPEPVSSPRAHRPSGRVEVTHPPELRTREV